MSNTSVTNIQGSGHAEASYQPSADPGAKDPRAYEEHVLEPTSGWIPVDWKELHRYRELLFFMVWRDIKVRYKQTVLGAAWAVVVPLVETLIFTVVFGLIAGMEFAGTVPFAVQVYAGMLGWKLFQSGVTQSGLSLMNQRNILTKIYFPRLYVPVGAVGTAMVDALIMVGVFLILLLLFQVTPAWTLIFTPLLLLLTVCAVLGFGFILSALTVSYRDFRYVVPFLMQALMLLSGVQYPLDRIESAISSVPEKLAGYPEPIVAVSSFLSDWLMHLLAINPMFGIVVNFRAAAFGSEPWRLDLLAISGTVAILSMIFGLYFFRRTERRFADIA